MLGGMDINLHFSVPFINQVNRTEFSLFSFFCHFVNSFGILVFLYITCIYLFWQFEGNTQADQRDPTPFIIEWIPDILPKSHIGELRIKFEYGHQRNGHIEMRAANASEPTPVSIHPNLHMNPVLWTHNFHTISLAAKFDSILSIEQWFFYLTFLAVFYKNCEGILAPVCKIINSHIRWQFF
jgi:hypothetical protein